MGTHLLKSIFLISLVCLTSIVTYAHDFEVNGIYYNITDPVNFEVQVTYKGSSYSDYDYEYSGKVVIPVIVTNGGTTYAVTSIGEYAFAYCYGLKSVTIGNSVTSIGESAFEACSGLISVTIGNSVASIGEDAFYYCRGLTSVTIPNSVASIGNSAFAYCYGLTSVIIGNSVTSIGDSAFQYCDGLISVTIPNSVTSIGNSAFEDCSGLKSVTIPNSVTSIGEGAFSYCSGLTSVTIPNSVTSIGEGAFSYCSGLTSIVVETGNTKYDSRENCNAIIDSDTNELIVGCKNTIIPNSVTSIGESAFENCSGLTSITIPNSVTSIGNSAFDQCYGLTSVTIGNSVTSIGESAFENCHVLTSVTIPNSVTSIGESAFEDCNGLTSVTIPNSVTSIGEGAFSYCDGLISVTIGNSVTSIGNYAFEDCSSLTSMVVETGNTKYDSRENCNAIIDSDTNELIVGCKNTIIPKSVTSIGEDAFYNCLGLTSITIPNSVTSIGNFAFEDCSGLKTIYNFSNLEFTKGSVYYGYIAFYAEDIYNAPNGSVEGDYIFGKSNSINTLLYYIGNDTDLTLPDNYRGENYVIGESVFKNNTTLSSVTIPNSVTSIGNSAFYDCYKVESLYISSAIETIGEYAFAGCTSISEIQMASKKAITANENIFSTDTYNNAILYVPIGRTFAFEKTSPWENFYIQEKDYAGIEDIIADDNSDEQIEYFNLNGVRVENPQNGIFIRRQGNKVEKVIVK